MVALARARHDPYLGSYLDFLALLAYEANKGGPCAVLVYPGANLWFLSRWMRAFASGGVGLC